MAERFKMPGAGKTNLFLDLEPCTLNLSPTCILFNIFHDLIWMGSGQKNLMDTHGQ